MQYYLVKDLKTKKVYMVQGATLESAREALQGVIGAPLGLEWVLHENSPKTLMSRFGVHNSESYWARHFKAGPVQDVTRLIKK